MSKKLIFLLVLCLTLFANIGIVKSEDKSELEKQQEEILLKLKELGNAKNTLANQIKIIDSQMELTLLKITQTETSIKILEKDITNLTVEIGKLEVQINQLSGVYINQTVQNYKLQKKIPAFAFLFSSNLNTYLEQQRYITSFQKNSQNNLINMETIRTNYDLQKTAKEEKQKELESLQKTLDSQKLNLNTQKITKDRLLQITKNDEKEYQKRLLVVQSKLSSFANTSAQCLNSSPGGGSDGNYFSQIDPLWCNQRPAGTEGCVVSGTNKPCTIGNIGCYITSTAMVLKKLGINTNPSIYASDINHIESSADKTAIDVPSGYKYCKYSNSNQQNIYKVIDSELSSGRYVIVQVPMSPYHFVVLIKGSNGNYAMHDPWKGADLSFNYSRIISARLITTQTCP